MASRTKPSIRTWGKVYNHPQNHITGFLSPRFPSSPGQLYIKSSQPCSPTIPSSPSPTTLEQKLSSCSSPSKGRPPQDTSSTRQPYNPSTYTNFTKLILFEMLPIHFNFITCNVVKVLCCHITIPKEPAVSSPGNSNETIIEMQPQPEPDMTSTCTPVEIGTNTSKH